MLITIRKHRRIVTFFTLIIVIAALLSLRWMSVFPLFAQTECGFADSIAYPIDTQQFRLVQAFGAPSGRHQGRYHTGEDWYGGRNTSYGQPVYAAAAGRVTYSYPLGWGRDGGVIIIEHSFRDGSTVYTQYGHITESETVTFPPRLSCVEAGQIIAVIADARPAPHVHFEIRLNQPDVPGPGYSWENPVELGWRNPSQFVSNMQTWLNPAHEWHLRTGNNTSQSAHGPITPPLVLNDNSILFLDDTTLRRATNDGRVMWRLTLEKRPVSITGLAGRPVLTFADGTMQYVSIEGTLEESWTVNAAFDGPPLIAGSWHIYPTPDQRLIALGPERREIVWQMDDVPEWTQAHLAGDENGFMIGLITPDDRFITLSQTEGILNVAQLREGASMTSGPDGALISYTKGGLWHIENDATWTLMLEDTPAGGSPGAVIVSQNGEIVLFDGRWLYAYAADGSRRWQREIMGISGRSTLSQAGAGYLLTSNHGNIAAISSTGRLCNQVKIYGDDRANQWHELGDDGILRVGVGDQFIGLNWSRFTQGCF